MAFPAEGTAWTKAEGTHMSVVAGVYVQEQTEVRLDRQTDRVQPVKGLECHAQVLNCFKSRGWEMRPQARRAPQAYSNTGPPHRFINTAPASPVASPLVEHRCLVAKW